MRIAKKDGLRAMVNTDCCECIYDPIQQGTQRKQVGNYTVSNLGSNDGSYQQAVYSPPNYKDLSSASKALDKVVGNFFDVCMAKCDGE